MALSYLTIHPLPIFRKISLKTYIRYLKNTILHHLTDS